MKLVYICSPLRGDMEKNIKNATAYCAYAAQQNVIPLAPHTIFTKYLDDTIAQEREKGLAMGIELLKRCDEIWVCGDSISQGMKSEIELAKQQGIPMKHLSESVFAHDISNSLEQERTLRIKQQIQEIKQYGPIFFTRTQDGEITSVMLPEEANQVLSPEDFAEVKDYIKQASTNSAEQAPAQIPEFELSQ